jgi:hypothetical protein
MTLCSSVNRGIYGYVAGAWMGARPPIYSSVTCNRGIYSNMFVGYIFLYSSVPRNIMAYICRRYIPR